MTTGAAVYIVLAIIGTIFLSHAFVGFKNHRGWISSFFVGLILVSLPSVLVPSSINGKLMLPVLLIMAGLGPALIWWSVLLKKTGLQRKAIICAVCGSLLTICVFVFGHEALQLIMDKVESYPAVATPE